MSAARSQPTPQKLSKSTMNLPRTFGGAYSVTRVTATGSCPPRPKPTRKRKNNSTLKLQARLQSPVATEYNTRVAMQVSGYLTSRLSGPFRLAGAANSLLGWGWRKIVFHPGYQSALFIHTDEKRHFLPIFGLQLLIQLPYLCLAFHIVIVQDNAAWLDLLQ